MKKVSYQSMDTPFSFTRRDFLKAGGVAGAGLVLGTPSLWAQEEKKQEKSKSASSQKIKTNIDDALKVPRTKTSLPGPFPGKVVEVIDSKAMVKDKPVAEAIHAMFKRGLTRLTGKDEKESFDLLFSRSDVVGIKVNPVGAGLISSRLEVVDAIVEWLSKNGIKRENIIIWDRFDIMLKDAGFTSERHPGIGIEGLQTMDMEAMQGKKESWLFEKDTHISEANFDKEVYYWADVEGPKDKMYLNQHVFNGKHSYFGKLVTKKLTKIINVPVFKNTGNGVSMATKNLGYGAICNTNRLHRPLFFDVCTEVLAFPALRDKVVLNITDGLRAQYEGGPMGNPQFAYVYNRLFFATDPFALDRVCTKLMVEKRKNMKIQVDEHPRYTEYLRYAERLGLGIGNLEKIDHSTV